MDGVGTRRGARHRRRGPRPARRRRRGYGLRAPADGPLVVSMVLVGLYGGRVGGLARPALSLVGGARTRLRARVRRGSSGPRGAGGVALPDRRASTRRGYAGVLRCRGVLCLPAGTSLVPSARCLAATPGA